MKNQLHMFFGYDNLSYSVFAPSKSEAVALVEAAYGAMKCYLGAQ